MSEAITLPHKFTPFWYQEEFLYQWQHKKRLVLVAHRRMGKDKTVFANLPQRMMQRVGTYFYFLPTYNQARKVIWNGADKDGFRFLSHFPKEIVAGINETEMKITLTNGSILQMVGADNIDRIVGTNPIGVVFSEYALMKPDVWDLISPILVENGGWAVFITTPRGKNHAFSMIQKNKDNPNWHIEILPVSYTKALNEDQINEQRFNMSVDKYNQEYECNFNDNATSVFKNVRAKTYPSHEWFESPTAIYQIGVDLAKVNDYTVITPFDLTTFRVAPQDCFNQIDYTLQKVKIEAAYLRYNRGRVIMDSTGVGIPIVDDLLNKGINVAPYSFTANSRNELLINLQILLEQGKISIPDDEELIDQLEAAVFEEMPNGRTKIVVPEPMHDDCFTKGTQILTDKGQKPIEEIKVGDLVMTREGLKPVVMTRSSRKNTVRNIGLEGTPTHPIITRDGNVNLANARESDTLYIWNEKLSLIEERSITDTQDQREDSTVSTIGGMTKIKRHPSHFIGKFGLIVMEKYQKATSFTTKIITHLTMTLEIWKSCLKANTQRCTLMSLILRNAYAQVVKSKQDESSEIWLGGDWKIQALLYQYIEQMELNRQLGQQPHSKNGKKTMLKEIKKSLDRMDSIKKKGLSKIWLIGERHSLLRKLFVWNVKRSFLTGLTMVVSFVALLVGVITLTRKRVYNLQVEGKHEYFANNILVHNCLMSLALAVWDIPHKAVTQHSRTHVTEAGGVVPFYEDLGY